MKTPAHVQRAADRDEESLCWTLGPGKKAKQFLCIFKVTSVTVLTGKDGRTPYELDHEDIAACLKHFEGRGWFPLSDSKTASERDPNGLGEYFFRNFGNPVFASHFAALWVHQRLLQAETRSRRICLRVVPAEY